MILELHERQSIAFESPATEIMYGGAAGGGKSHLLRAAAIAWCVAIPGLQVYLFRRVTTDLIKNHIEGPTGFPVLLADWMESGYASWNASKNYITIGPSRIHLCHCQYEKDVYKYQGAEIHVLMMDELTHFTAAQYKFLRSRVRMGGLLPSDEYRGRFPRIVSATNPGGVGHNWVKAAFVDPAPPLDVWKTDDDEGGMLRQFIPALLEDNPTLLETDPNYEHRLHGLGNPALVRAMRYGDWDIVAGGMFDDVWSPEKHIVEPFEIPAAFRVDRSFDWGSSKPFSVGWHAQLTEPFQLPDGRLAPRDSVIRIGEWYGWDGRNPNQGVRMSDKEIALGTLERETALGIKGRVAAGPADAAIFALDNDNTSIAGTMEKHGVKFTPADKRPGSRKAGWQRCRNYLKAALDGDREHPWYLVFNTCRQFIRTIPALPRSERDPDDVDTDAEDHVGDEWRYRLSVDKQPITSHKFRLV